MYLTKKQFYDGSPARTEFLIGGIVAATVVIKVAMFGSALSILGDIIFILGVGLLRSKAALIMLLICSSIAIPSVPGLDKIFGGPFLIEILAASLFFKAWRASNFSTKLFLPKALVAVAGVYIALLVISIARGGGLSAHLVTTRYFLLLVITAYVVRRWVCEKSITRESIEELLFRSIRAGLAIYCVLFIMQFFLPEIYDQIFRSSGGEREGTRVAYQIQGYIPLVSLALLFSGTVNKSDQNFPQFYREIASNKWIALALFGMVATGARMVLLQWIIVALVFIFIKSRKAFAGIFFAVAISVVILNLPMFAGLTERFASISNPDSFIANLGIRLLPALLAINEMTGIEYIIGKGLDYKFFVPWFETRSDDFNAYSTFIDQLWATIFVQAGIAGCLLALFPFIAGVAFYRKYRVALRSTPTIRFLIIFYLIGIHGFSNLAYSKNVYVIVGFLAGSLVVFRLNKDLSSSVV